MKGIKILNHSAIARPNPTKVMKNIDKYSLEVGKANLCRGGKRPITYFVEVGLNELKV